MTEGVKPRIVHIEDSESWREMLGEMFEKGFDPERTQFESRADCDLLNQELADGRQLADVYILDNEIGWEYGGQKASQIYDKAQREGREVTVITLLCSSPEMARREYGKDLDARSIPVLDKLEHAPLTGFYIARCLTRGKVTWDKYLAEENINLGSRGKATDRMDVQIGMYGSITHGETGAFYQSPYVFVTENRAQITRFMKEPIVQLMDSIFLPPLAEANISQ